MTGISSRHDVGLASIMRSVETFLIAITQSANFCLKVVQVQHSRGQE